ncbi:hypothetical protein RE428_28670 [Marinobacter nanhaiticus D15-8W]|uniref:DUF2066 domain-containing protein n=1 Tax=Marinobacter nanhaiticus D15-8W TaxID=626887 RepID=N6WSC7_9GAMM|nr:DUF2066 domain-containing protein [Marinobacter nanhaiticus]ENO14456.2 DUF2066 domain-containing protein [Marinobacter nanhaiticus D15-8W]BES71849.1 hypothetical protein RE428_28670 [Marinobacter nanhaiticus D15-8W]
MNSAVMPQIRTLLLFLFTLVPVAASAVTVEGLYRTQVPVAGSTEEAQQAAYAEGLRQVLSRVAGNREVLESEQIGPLLDNAESLLQSYQYQRSPEGTDMLSLTFGSVAVNRALADMQVPVWGANRPLTLAWVAVDSGRDRWVLTSNDDGLDERGRWARAFSEAAAERGLPLALPPEEVRQDRDLLSEIRGQFMENLQAKAKNYAGNLVSVVNVSRRGSDWEARWRLEGPAFNETGEIRGAGSSEALADAVVDAWADKLAARYSVEAGEVSDAQRVDLKIENVASLEAYGAVLNSLNGMTPVVSAGPVRVNGNVATMRVSFSGELSVLQEYIALDSRFVPQQVGSESVSMAGEDAANQTRQPTSSQPGESSQQASGSTAEPEQEAVAQRTETGGSQAQSQQSPSSGQGNQSLLQYRPIESGSADEEDSEQSFESLYPVLRYRWAGVGGQVPGLESGVE